MLDDTNPIQLSKQHQMSPYSLQQKSYLDGQTRNMMKNIREDERGTEKDGKEVNGKEVDQEEEEQYWK